MKTLCLLAILPALASAQETIEKLDPALDAILSSEAKIETLCTGFDWVEGPVWDEKGKRLLFSDVPRNTIYQWKEGDTEATVYMKPSGFTGVERYSDFDGYGDTFRWTKAHHDVTPRLDGISLALNHF